MGSPLTKLYRCRSSTLGQQRMAGPSVGPGRLSGGEKLSLLKDSKKNLWVSLMKSGQALATYETSLGPSHQTSLRTTTVTKGGQCRESERVGQSRAIGRAALEDRPIWLTI